MVDSYPWYVSLGVRGGGYFWVPVCNFSCFELLSTLKGTFPLRIGTLTLIKKILIFEIYKRSYKM